MEAKEANTWDLHSSLTIGIDITKITIEAPLFYGNESMVGKLGHIVASTP